jgi:outer membrane protein assembly factor BamD (BamD/ComL family)
MNKLSPKNISRALYLVLLTGTVFCIAACASSMLIAEDLSPAEIIQRAQEASDRNRYKLALQYYQALLERNPTNIDLVCTAEYEIAFIHYKQKKYTDARMELNALLARYNTPDEELLPPQFKRLANIVLDRITEKEKPKFPFTLFRKKAAE